MSPLNLKNIKGIFLYSPLLFGMAALSFWHRDFVKINLKHIYVLEIIFLLTVLVFVIKNIFIEKKSPILLSFPLKSLFLFSLWGFLLLGIDLFFKNTVFSSYSRILQHCLLFIYPLLWVPMGYYLAKYETWICKLVLITILLGNTLAFFLRTPIFIEKTNILIINNNISVGPILVLLSFFAFYNYIHTRNLIFLILSAGGLLLSYWPIWLLWQTSMQRTSLLILLFMIGTAPLILFWKKWKIMFSVSTISLSIFLVGSLIVTQWGRAPNIESSGTKVTDPIFPQNRFIASLNHSDDFYGTAPKGVFKYGGFAGRFRTFAWSTAIQDWLQNPIIGIGFIDEVPSMVLPNIKNDGSHIIFQDLQNPETTKPVIGPHNSFLTILARMGIIGFLLFTWFCLQWVKNILPMFQSDQKNFYSLLLLFIPVNGMIHAFFNIGLESPQNCIFLWLVVGMAVAHNKFYVKKELSYPSLSGQY